MKKAFPIPVRVKYSCAKCPAYCCSYPEIEATPRDIQRLARHFGLGYEQAEERFTTRDPADNVRLLRHRQDRIFDSVCVLLDQETRRCTAYGSRPAVHRFDLSAFSRIAESVVAGVMASGSMRSSRIAGLPEARARSNAGAKSSVRSTTSPCAPNARAYAAKSGFLSSVPNTRPGYSRSWCMRIVP